MVPMCLYKIVYISRTSCWYRKDFKACLYGTTGVHLGFTTQLSNVRKKYMYLTGVNHTFTWCILFKLNAAIIRLGK